MKSTVKSPGRTVRAGRTHAVLAGLFALTVCWFGTGIAQSNTDPIPSDTAIKRGCRDSVIPFYKDLVRILPEWVAALNEAPQVVEGIVHKSHISSEDVPAFHVSHDWNADVLLDPAYNPLTSTENETEAGGRIMEIEWESAFFPPQFWPAPGDRAWILGRWIFDCSHPPYKTEIHPPKAVAFTHTEPVIFPGDQRPSQSSLTHVYIHGRGGYYKRPVVGQNYNFDVPLPPRPAQPSTLRTTILSLPFGGPSPTLTLVPNSDPPRMHVTYPLEGVSDPNNTARFGAVIAATWQTSTPNPNEARSRLLRVTFDSIKINDDHDTFFSGEWRLWLRAGGQWFEVSGLGDVDDGETVGINRSVELIVPDDGTLEIQTSGWENDCDSRFRRRDADIKLWDADKADLLCLVNGNNKIGVLERSFKKSDGFGIGSHDETSRADGDENLRDFNLRYRVELVQLFEPPSTPPGNSTGSLLVTLNGVPSNPPIPPVEVTGPGFRLDLNNTATLTGLTPGSYTIKAFEFTTVTGPPNRPNCRLFSPSPSSDRQATVTGNQTASVTVKYTSSPCGA